jgi:hypothetical protein
MTTGTNKPDARDSDPAARAALPTTRYPDRVEDYDPIRMAEFLLNNAVNPADYATAVEEVRKLGIDPASIPHEPPPGA